MQVHINCVDLEDIIGRVILRKSASIAFSIYFDKLKLILKLTLDRAKLSLKFRYCKKATRFEKKISLLILKSLSYVKSQVCCHLAIP